jgi:hypothetical protein
MCITKASEMNSKTAPEPFAAPTHDPNVLMKKDIPAIKES